MTHTISIRKFTPPVSFSATDAEKIAATTVLAGTFDLADFQDATEMVKVRIDWQGTPLKEDKTIICSWFKPDGRLFHEETVVWKHYTGWGAKEQQTAWAEFWVGYIWWEIDKPGIYRFVISEISMGIWEDRTFTVIDSTPVPEPIPEPIPLPPPEPIPLPPPEPPPTPEPAPKPAPEKPGYLKTEASHASQYTINYWSITIPILEAELLGLSKGESMKWIAGSSFFDLSRESGRILSKVQKIRNKYYRIIMPQAIVKALGLTSKTKFLWGVKTEGQSLRALKLETYIEPKLPAKTR